MEEATPISAAIASFLPVTRSRDKPHSREDVVVAEAAVRPHRKDAVARHRLVVVIANEGRQPSDRCRRGHPYVLAEGGPSRGAGIERIEVDVAGVEALVLPDDTQAPIGMSRNPGEELVTGILFVSCLHRLRPGGASVARHSEPNVRLGTGWEAGPVRSAIAAGKIHPGHEDGAIWRNGRSGKAVGTEAAARNRAKSEIGVLQPEAPWTGEACGNIRSRTPV